MKRFTWLWTVLIFGAAVAALLPAAPYTHSPSTDSAVFLYVGKGILNGQLPYHDLFDHKPPVVYFIDALGLALDGGSLWGVWALQLIFTLAAALMSFFFLRKYYRQWVAAYATLACLINLALVLERGNLTEEYALPFLFGSLWLFSGLDQQKGFRWRSYLFGALFGLALMTKQTMVGIWASLGLVFILQMIAVKDWRRMIELGRWVVGAILTTIPWIFYFAVNRILGDFWDAAFSFNFIYSATAGNTDRLAALSGELNFITTTSGFFTFATLTWLASLVYILFNHEPSRRALTNRWMGILAVLGAFYLLYKGSFEFSFNSPLSPWRLQQLIFSLLLGVLAVLYFFGVIQRRVYPWLKKYQSSQPLPLLPLFIAVIDVPVELVLINISTANYEHYYIAILPAFTILIAGFLSMLVSWNDATQKRAMPALWVGLFLLPFLQNGIGLILNQSQVGNDNFTSQMAAYVRLNTKPDDYVLTWGFNAQVNFLAVRRSPTRYFTQMALFHNGYASPARFTDLLNELKAHPPELILDTHMEGYPFVNWSLVDRQCSYNISLPDGLGPVLDYVCQNYELVERFGKDQWSIYRLRTQ